LRERVPGHFLGEQLEAAPQMVESLMAAPRPVPAPETIPDLYLQALEHFEERQSFVEARVIDSLHAAGYAHKHLVLANRELGLNISAALALGDMDFLGTGIGWVTGLLGNWQLPIESLYGYLYTYRQSVMEQLDERGQPISNWLGQLLNGYAPN